MRPHCNTIIVCLTRLNNGGIERQISLVTPLWIKMGYKVIVATIETPTPNDYPLPEDCVRTVLPIDIGRYYGCLHELVCEYHADTIFHHVLTGPHFLVAALVATDLKLNLLGEYHTSYTYFLHTLSPEWSRVHRRLGLCDRSVTLSRSMCTFYKALGMSNCRYIPNKNLPTKSRTRIECENQKFFELVWVGRPDDSVKGIEDIIPIMEHLRMLSVHLTVVGQIDEETPVVKAVRQAGLEQIISFVGFQKDV